MLDEAGTALVTLMVTAAWEQAREGVVAVWRRIRPGQAGSVEGELEEARAELVQAEQDGEADQVRRELATEWQARLRRVLRDEPEAAAELQRILDDARGAVADTAGPSVRMRARAEGHGRVFQAGRDIHLSGGQA
ncbi:hypothetical protein [Streptomyces halobius]|uniref:Uncharacterized protein n=1 Tax=Streptomyces halobius TaxID=2879846 RepID=A0ABY4M979_9ACTN|nr:hypothetical protein [Streptomyces halobius]UQA93329.1 hypothetical protein K9S39_17080 [Streptomyces halobius]